MQNKQRISLFVQQRKLLILTMVLFRILIATVNYRLSGSQINLRIKPPRTGVLFYLGAFGGIAAVTGLSQLIAQNVVLQYIGKHSLVVFAWHNILFIDLKN